MGTSITVPVLGRTRKTVLEDGTITFQEVTAMNKTEMAQKRHYMLREGTPIFVWYAQTQTGAKMIGASRPFEEIPDAEIKHVKLAICPICCGIGHKPGAWCPVCEGTGVTRKSHEKRWQTWQLENIKARFE